MIRLRSFKKKDHSSRRLLLILAMIGSFLRFYLMYADRRFLCSVSVSFSRIFPLYAPLERAAVLQSGNETSRLFVASRYGFGAFCHPFKESNPADLDKPSPFLRCFPALVRRMRHFSCRSYSFWTVIHLSRYCVARNYQLQSS